MAGDWISMRHDLADDPAVVRIAAVCSIPRQHVVGCLHGVWSWFDRHTRDGRALRLKSAFVDELTGVQGFASAMEHVAWLRISGDAVTIPKFREWMSQSAKKRQLTARRVARHRKRQCNADVTPGGLPQNRTAESEESTVSAVSDAAVDPADAAAGKANAGIVALDIQRLMGKRGCDASLRKVVSRFADPRVVRKLAEKYDRKRAKIQNPGGWWRDQLRRAGVKVV